MAPKNAKIAPGMEGSHSADRPVTQGSGGSGMSGSQKLSEEEAEFHAKITEEKEQIIQNVFNLFDVQHDGAIATKELGQCLAAMGVKNLSRDYLRELMKKYDADESGELDYEEFIVLMQEAFPNELRQIELLFKPNE